MFRKITLFFLKIIGYLLLFFVALVALAIGAKTFWYKLLLLAAIIAVLFGAAWGMIAYSCPIWTIVVAIGAAVGFISYLSLIAIQEKKIESRQAELIKKNFLQSR